MPKQRALQALPGLLGRVRSVLDLWRVDNVQDEGSGNQAHQPRHKPCIATVHM